MSNRTAKRKSNLAKMQKLLTVRKCVGSGVWCLKRLTCSISYFVGACQTGANIAGVKASATKKSHFRPAPSINGTTTTHRNTHTHHSTPTTPIPTYPTPHQMKLTNLIINRHNAARSIFLIIETHKRVLLSPSHSSMAPLTAVFLAQIYSELGTRPEIHHLTIGHTPYSGGVTTLDC